jgi:hypothetical protein
MAKLQPMMNLTKIAIVSERVTGVDKDSVLWTQFRAFPKNPKRIKCGICYNIFEQGDTYWQNKERECVCDHHVSF